MPAAALAPPPHFSYSTLRGAASRSARPRLPRSPLPPIRAHTRPWGCPHRVCGRDTPRIRVSARLCPSPGGCAADRAAACPRRWRPARHVQRDSARPSACSTTPLELLRSMNCTQNGPPELRPDMKKALPEGAPELLTGTSYAADDALVFGSTLTLYFFLFLCSNFTTPSTRAKIV